MTFNRVAVIIGGIAVVIGGIAVVIDKRTKFFRGTLRNKRL